MKLWIENAPIINKNTNEEVIEFIEKHISCKRDHKDPEIKALVEKFQIHRCTDSCKRNYKGMKYCRYTFPRKFRRQTIINQLDNILSKSCKLNY